MHSESRSGKTYTLVFGLSADPVHQGHYELAIRAVRGLIAYGYQVNTVLLMPVYRRSPVGGGKDWLPKTYDYRYHMCELAALDMQEALPDVDFHASRVEADLVQDSRKANLTADTLQYLKQNLAVGEKLIFLISSEIVSGKRPQFAHWYKPDQILGAAVLAVCPRPGYDANLAYLDSLVASGYDVVYLPDVQTPDVAANMLRTRLCNGESPADLANEGLLSARIATYIQTEAIYDSCTR